MSKPNTVNNTMQNTCTQYQRFRIIRGRINRGSLYIIRSRIRKWIELQMVLIPPHLRTLSLELNGAENSEKMLQTATEVFAKWLRSCEGDTRFHVYFDRNISVYLFMFIKFVDP